MVSGHSEKIQKHGRNVKRKAEDDGETFLGNVLKEQETLRESH